jgi:UDP-glucose 4-epimerase
VNYLVTGGCGFIGSHLVDALIAAGHKVRILDDLSTGNLGNKHIRAELVEGDVARAGVVEDALAGIDGIFHLAAVASVERCTLDWPNTHRTNMAGTVAVFDAARKDRIPVVYASSAAVYGRNCDVLDEDTKPHPLSAYGADKYGCELHGFVANHVHGVPNYGMRFFNVYGPRQDPRSPYSGVITIFTTKMRNREVITINGDGYHTRDFIYVGDVVTALRLAMDHCRETREVDVFNVCTGRETNLIDLVDTLAVALRARPTIKHGPERPGDPRRSVGCPNKAKRVLNFVARRNLSEGLVFTVRGSPVLEDHGG